MDRGSTGAAGMSNSGAAAASPSKGVIRKSPKTGDADNERRSK
jgi:hypothetical protein